MNGFFITGTDTDIGKTVLSALLLAELRRRGIHTAPMKPAQTGCPRSTESNPLLRAPDLDYSLAMAGMTVSDAVYPQMAPSCFEPACSPHLAAELAGTEIHLVSILDAARTLASEYDRLIVEGAGGVLVPLNRRDLMLDLIRLLDLPVILAARPGLGTINHTLLSVRALRSANISITGIVLVESEKSDSGFIEEDNLMTIEQFTSVPILGALPYCPQLQEKEVTYEILPLPVVAAMEAIVNRLERQK